MNMSSEIAAGAKRHLTKPGALSERRGLADVGASSVAGEQIGSVSVVFERHYTCKELAAAWGFGESTIREWFIDLPGVLKLQQSRTRSKRQYVSLRIPR